MKPRVINQRRLSRIWALILIVGLLGSYVAWALKRPLPTLKPQAAVISIKVPSSRSQLVWPATTQSAVGIVNSPVLETHGAQLPVSTASTAKIITALVVLNKKPLKPGQAGPTITLTDDDVALYKSYAGQDGSVMPVQAGEKLTELQMLQAMLLPSANNIADSLAIWSYGSLPAYAEAANNYLADHHLSSSHVGSDASGLSPNSVSTAGDLVKLGKLAMQQPVLAQIVAQPAVDGIPVAGTIKNVNFLLGTNGIVGIKTGNSDQAGGVFVSASSVEVNNKPVTLVTTVIGSPSLFQAMKDSLPLIKSAQTNFRHLTVVKAGTVVGSYKLPWSDNVPVIASQDLNLTAWNGDTVLAKPRLKSLASISHAGETAGSILSPNSGTTNQISVPVQLSSTPSQPSALWRLFHPF